MTWMHRLRLKVLAIALGVALTAIALISLTTIPAWPIVGVAFAAAAVVVNQMSSRLSGTICHGCGTDIAGVPGGAVRRDVPELRAPDADPRVLRQGRCAGAWR